jgi:hypothetical protein
MLSEFVLMHTQRGKTAFTKQLLSRYPDHMPFFVLDNNTALAVQMQDALADMGTCLALHSLGNTDERAIKEHISHCVQPPIVMAPIVMALNNKHQIPKLQRLMKHAQSLGLRTILVVDEADKTYPHCRDALYSCADRWIFVSATLGQLHKYPECAAAVIRHAPDTLGQYRGIMSENSRALEYTIEGNKEQSALNCIREKRDYFFGRVGERHRKVLIHGSSIVRMVALTNTLAAEGWGVVCVVGPGTFAAKDGRILGGLKTRKIAVAHSIAALCDKYQLCSDRPLAVIGNRKMDRGITYHSWGDGIIFTDCLLGNVASADAAVQKAGRLAGNVAHRPEFCGALTWWSNAATLSRIINQCATIAVAKADSPICTTFNQGAFVVLGPFKHQRQLNSHTFILKTPHNTVAIKKGAPWCRQAYNTSFNNAIILLNNFPCFAAKIQQLYYILYRQ